MRGTEAIQSHQACTCGVDIRVGNPESVNAFQIRPMGTRHSKGNAYGYTMDRPKKLSHLDLIESTLYSASTLLLHKLPFDYDALRSVVPQTCALYATLL